MTDLLHMYDTWWLIYYTCMISDDWSNTHVWYLMADLLHMYNILWLIYYTCVMTDLLHMYIWWLIYYTCMISDDWSITHVWYLMTDILHMYDNWWLIYRILHMYDVWLMIFYTCAQLFWIWSESQMVSTTGHRTVYDKWFSFLTIYNLRWPPSTAKSWYWLNNDSSFEITSHSFCCLVDNPRKWEIKFRTPNNIEIAKMSNSVRWQK